MCSHDQSGHCDKTPGFSLMEKIHAQGCFYLGMGTGIAGLWPTSPLLALGYAGYGLLSFILLMRYTICPRCPHLREADDCLFLPASLARLLVGAEKSGPLAVWERAIFFCAFGGTVFIPAPWLLDRPGFLVPYALFWSASLVGMLLHTCRKCRVEACPFNRGVASR